MAIPQRKRKTTIPIIQPTLVSLLSWAGFFKMGLPCGRLMGLMAIPECKLESGIVLGKKGRRFHPRQHETQPNATDTDGGCEIQPAHFYSMLMKGRHDEPVDVHQVHQKQKRCQNGQRHHMPLDAAEQEQKEGQEEMEQCYGCDDPFPVAGDAVEIPVNFGGKIARIDNEQLAKRDVGPEQNEG